MIIDELSEQKHMTKYKPGQSSKVPYKTLNDLRSGKTSISKCKMCLNQTGGNSYVSK